MMKRETSAPVSDPAPAAIGGRPAPPPAWLYAVAPAILSALTLTYVIAPSAYLEFVHQKIGREQRLVELITFIAALAAGLLLGWVAVRAWRGPGDPRQSGRAGAIMIGLVAIASIFFAGEEVSWGQSLFGWDTPEFYRGLSVDTNLHNTALPVQALGGVFLVVMFFAVPWLWHARWPRPLPASLVIAVAEGPVIVSMACAFAWKELKTLYKVVQPDYLDRAVYSEFIEQFNEHKELVVAMTLLMYGVLRLRAARVGGEPPVGEDRRLQEPPDP